jgi:hypothetical protein
MIEGLRPLECWGNLLDSFGESLHLSPLNGIEDSILLLSYRLDSVANLTLSLYKVRDIILLASFLGSNEKYS